MIPRSFLIFSLIVSNILEHTWAYDPLTITQTSESIELMVNDSKRKREVPLRVYLPAAKTTAPVILFSHGLGGSKEVSPFLGQHWAARGYVAVFLQHPGSDTSVWKDAPVLERMKAMQEAASVKNFMLRVGDVTAVLDQLEAWQAATDHPLAGRLDLEHIGMSGHSFGAVTTQAVSGQATPRGDTSMTDSRIRAALPMSPSEPSRGTPEQAFGQVTIPWLLMTGTNDTSLIGNSTAESRRLIYPALPPGHAYELVLHNAEHSAFTERALPGDQKTRNPNHHRVILAVSTAFWDAYLRGDSAARAWLDGSAARSVMEAEDIWQRK
jgi:predicted dienelactone hydrolase